MTNGYSPRGWYVDPMSPGAARYWNGVGWTTSVSRGGVVFNAPMDPSRAALPPVPGTQIAAQPPTSAGGPTEYTLPSGQSSNDSTLGVVLGVLVAFFLILMIFAIVGSNGSSEQPPPSTDAPVTTEAPAEGG